MKKIIFTSVFFSVLLTTVFAQVGIGTNSPNASSILDLSSTSKAFIPPRMTTTQRDQIANPVAGMMIYNSTTACVEFYKGTGWYNVCTGATSTLSSNNVAAANLIAHWTFDTDSKEVISNTAAFSGGTYNVGTTTFGAGRIGNAATFVNGALVYPTIPNLNLDTALQSYTVSMWIKMKSREGVNTKWSSLFQLNSNAYTDVFGIVGIQALNQKSKDTLSFQIDQVQIDGTGPHLGGFGCGGCFGGVTNPLDLKVDTTKWSLLTVTYNGVGLNQKLKVYLDGVVKDSLTLTTVKKPNLATAETFRIKPSGGTIPPIPAAWEDFVTIGTFNWRDFPVFSSTNGYSSYSPYVAERSAYMANGINGSIDDIRVFNTAISAAEVSDLYTRGLTGN